MREEKVEPQLRPNEIILGGEIKDYPSFLPNYCLLSHC